jgi:hypothetical protein
MKKHVLILLGAAVAGGTLVPGGAGLARAAPAGEAAGDHEPSVPEAYHPLKRITIKLNGGPLEGVLAMIVQLTDVTKRTGTGLSVAPGEDDTARAPVTVEIDNGPLWEVLLRVSESSGVAFEHQLPGGIVFSKKVPRPLGQGLVGRSAVFLRPPEVRQDVKDGPVVILPVVLYIEPEPYEFNWGEEPEPAAVSVAVTHPGGEPVPLAADSVSGWDFEVKHRFRLPRDLMGKPVTVTAVVVTNRFPGRHRLELDLRAGAKAEGHGAAFEVIAPARKKYPMGDEELEVFRAGYAGRVPEGAVVGAAFFRPPKGALLKAELTTDPADDRPAIVTGTAELVEPPKDMAGWKLVLEFAKPKTLKKGITFADVVLNVDE